MMRISELHDKDVIDSNDGKRLGFIRDIELDLDRGGVEAIVIPSESRFFSLFGKGDETVLHWRQIKKIGVDVILVDQGHATPKAAAPASSVFSSQPGPLAEDEDGDFYSF